MLRTVKGRSLVAKFGERQAVWLWRGVLVTGGIFGLCLATGFIRPIDWNS